MFLRCILLVLSIPPLAETCVPTVPPEEYYPTASLPEETTRPMQVTPVMSTTAGGGGATVASTTAGEENMCGDCDINDIAPVSNPPDTEFTPTQKDPVDGCLRTSAFCHRTDDMFCDEILMLAETPTQTISITDMTTASAVEATLTCDKDGTYSWGDVKMISRLSCTYNMCY